MRLLLKTKVSLYIALVIFSIGAARTYFSISGSLENIEKKLLARGEALNFSLANAAEEGLVTENLDLLRKAAHIVHSEDVVLVQVYSTIWDAIDAYPFEELKKPPDPGAVSHFRESSTPFNKKIDGLYDFYNPIFYKPFEGAPSIPIGYVRIVLSASKLQEELKSAWTTDIVITIIVTLIILAALNIVINRLVINPVMRLRKSVSEVKSGRLPAAIPAGSHDEIGELIASFNHMAETIDKDTIALKKAEEKFSKAFSSSPTLMSISTLHEGRFIEVNDAFLKASGYQKEEVLGHTGPELGIWIEPAEREKMLRQLTDKGIVYGLETRIRIKSGETLTVLFSAELIDIEGEQCILAVMLDITDRKKLENQLLQAQKMEAVGQLAGGIAHDFNNIITAVFNYGYLIKNRLREDDPLRDNINKILSLSDRAAQITRGLLAFSRKQYFEFMPVNLNEIIRDIKNMLEDFIGEDIEVHTKLSDKDITIVADKTQIEQVIVNLSTNARDAMPNGGRLNIETELAEITGSFIKTHGFGEPGTYALLSVSDTGTGMDEGTRQRIFEPFFTTKEVGKGTGLGLSVVYGIIKQHNGYINVYSEPGKGTTFRIYLPEIRASVEKEKEKKPLQMTGRPATILVAEDEPAVRDSIRDILEEYGYKVIEAVDGQDAVEKFAGHKDEINLLLLDVVMPRKNGKETFEEIRRMAPGIKAIFTSGYTADIILRKKILEEDVILVSKPILPDSLLAKIREVIESEH